MYVVGIMGSPRIGGNTDILLDSALEGAKAKGAKVEKIILNKLKFSPCQECENVKDDGSCIIQDDMQEVYKKIGEADGVVIASPIFFGSLSAQTKMMIDRFQCAWRVKFILKKDIFTKKKKGIFLSVEGSDRNDFFDNAKSVVKNFYATVNTQYIDEILCSGVDDKASILKHQDFLNAAFKLGMKIASG